MNSPILRSTGTWMRRDILRVGSLSAFGLGAGMLGSRVLSAGPEPAALKQKAKRAVLIWLDGGPSHLETFDPKPNAPKEVRGPLESIATAVPGVTFTECLPGLAQRMDQISVIRSVTSPLGEHNFGTQYMLTGYRPNPVIDYPTFGSVLTYLQPSEGVLPPNTAVPNFRVGGAKVPPNGFLPASTAPFNVGGDPAKPDFRVRDLEVTGDLNLSRLERRNTFVREFNRLQSPAAETEGGFEDAVKMLTQSSSRDAFDLSQESEQDRNRYGRRTVGQSCLLARRLLERGVSFVTVNHRGWDTHTDLFNRLKNGYAGAKTPVGLIPTLDQACSSLIDDLRDRGMLDDTLVMVMGEFGRTPKLNTNAGRDHWPRVFSVMLAGGGIPGGTIIGSSDRVGESPKDDPVTPSDVAATVYSILGIPIADELETPDGRTIRIANPEARPIQKLLG